MPPPTVAVVPVVPVVPDVVAAVSITTPSAGELGHGVLLAILVLSLALLCCVVVVSVLFGMSKMAQVIRRRELQVSMHEAELRRRLARESESLVVSRATAKTEVGALETAAPVLAPVRLSLRSLASR